MFVYIQLEDHCGLSGLHRRGSLSRHFLVRSCESKSTPPLKPQCPEAPTPEKDPALLAIPQLDSYIYICTCMLRGPLVFHGVMSSGYNYCFRLVVPLF